MTKQEDQGEAVPDSSSATPVSLEALLARMTVETFQDEADFGLPVGREIW
jgi:antitoxin component of MazEF toxin-antitoxin module